MSLVCACACVCVTECDLGAKRVMYIGMARCFSVDCFPILSSLGFPKYLALVFVSLLWEIIVCAE